MVSLDDKLPIIQKEIAEYATDPANGRSYLAHTNDEHLFAVIDITRQQDKRYADASLIVRIEGDRIIVECDMNDKPLVDALVQVGIPREQIILAYAGESVPETNPSR